MINHEISTTELGTNVSGPTTAHKQPALAAKKVALKDVQNQNNNNFARPRSLIPLEGQLFADTSKTCGTKRPTPDYASTPVTNNIAHERFNYPRRKYDFAGYPKSASLGQSQQEVGQISGKNLHYGSRFKEANDEQWADRFIRLQNFIKQCDGSDHRENIQLLARLSPSELSKHAVELEKRAIQLTIEEGKEMQRMQTLNILGKPSTTKNPIPVPITQHKN